MGILDAYGASLGSFLGDKEPEQGETWLLPGIIAASVPQIIAGPPKAMKSYMALSIALALARGEAWLHADFKPSRRCKVLILPKEDSANETKRRLWWLSRGIGVAPDELSDYLYVDAETPFRFDDDNDVGRMQATIEKIRPDLIIVDSLTESHRRDENSAGDMKPVIDNWANLCRRNNVAIACIHHFRKPSYDSNNGGGSAGGRLRGSSALHARVRHIVGVDPKERAISKIRVEGNLQGLPDNFLVRMQESVDGSGKPCYRMSFNGWE
jgi:RecA-family ATPase